MSERREFFEVAIDFSQLEIHARSSDSTMRWASAFELGLLDTEEAISLLWSLTTDSDENVRDAAKLGLNQSNQQLVGKVLAVKWTVEPNTNREDSDQQVVKHVPWKVRPLEAPSTENSWAVDAAVLNIIQTEGPVTGARLFRLYANAVYLNASGKFSKSKIEGAIYRLERRNLVSHIQDYGNGEIEYWTLYGTGTPEVFVREQGQRKLGEIPITEVIGRLRIELQDEFDSASQNKRFEALMKVYSIKQAELHILGDIFAKEWSTLLTF